jgi:signal transduction histidine kinase
VQWQLALAIGLVVGAGLTIPVIFWLAKRAEARARRSERRARAAEHLAEVGTLTGALAHEIRNPLSTLTLNLQLLREDMTRPGQTPEPRVLAKLDTIEQEARRLQTILDDFLKFAGQYEVHLAVQPVNPVLEEVVSFYADRLQRAGVQVRTSFAENLPAAAVDAARLKQALSNLVLNAEAAMPQGGELLISSEADGRNLKVHITDTGAGIPQEALDKIFRPYYSTRPGGTGLGLPTVQRIVREHDGRLEVHSEPGRGTRFTIYLPAAETSRARQGT